MYYCTFLFTVVLHSLQSSQSRCICEIFNCAFMPLHASQHVNSVLQRIPIIPCSITVHFLIWFQSNIFKFGQLFGDFQDADPMKSADVTMCLLENHLSSHFPLHWRRLFASLIFAIHTIIGPTSWLLLLNLNRWCILCWEQLGVEICDQFFFLALSVYLNEKITIYRRTGGPCRQT